jgi:hypothetical protein
VIVYSVYTCTGSQLHVDPDLMGAWNLLLTGSSSLCTYV